MTKEINAAFGIPSDSTLIDHTSRVPSADTTTPAPTPPEDRIAALRARAVAQAAAEFDEEKVYAQFLAEEKAKREDALRERASEDAVPPVEGIDDFGFPEKYVWLTVARGGQAHDSEYCTPGINGFVWKIRRGEKVAVHEVVAKVLENAVSEVIIQSEGGIISRPSPAWPFSVHGPCSKEEYKIYQAKMRTMTAQQAALEESA
jgi:hypothetical protein